MNSKFVIVLALLLVMFGCNNNEPAVSQNKDVESSQNKHDSNGGLLSSDNILNIAHRGASGHAPEHTLVAYELGEDMGADYIEIDLQMTEDNELIAMHDDSVTRTADGDGPVQDFTLEEMTGLDVGSWFNDENPADAEQAFKQARVPSLDDIFDTFGKNAKYYIETKTPEATPDMVEKLMETLEKYHLLDDDVPRGQIIIQSFSEASLKEVQDLDASIPLIQLISYQAKADISTDQLQEIADYAVGIGANYKYLTREYVEKVRRANLLLHPYTVNEIADMKRLIDWGATGIFTNYPGRLNGFLEERKKDKDEHKLHDKLAILPLNQYTFK